MPTFIVVRQMAIIQRGEPMSGNDIIKQMAVLNWVAARCVVCQTYLSDSSVIASFARHKQ